MTDKLREAAQQAEREAFEAWAEPFSDLTRSECDPKRYAHDGLDLGWQAWQARAALAQQDAQGQKQRPDSQWYARMIQNTLDDDFVIGPPPPAQRVELTDDEISRIYTEQTGSHLDDSPWDLAGFARAAIEEHLRKNKMR